MLGWHDEGWVYGGAGGWRWRGVQGSRSGCPERSRMGATGTPRQRKDFPQPPLLLLDQGERVERGLHFSQFAPPRAGALRPCQQSRARGLRGMVAPDDPAALLALFFDLQGRTEVVLQRAPHLRVERVDGTEQRGDLQPFVAQELPRMAPVFLLHMRVVVLVAGPRAQESHGLLALGKIASQVVVDEVTHSPRSFALRAKAPPFVHLAASAAARFAAIVAVKSQQREGQCGLDFPRARFKVFP